MVAGRVDRPRIPQCHLLLRFVELDLIVYRLESFMEILVLGVEVAGRDHGVQGQEGRSGAL